MKQRTGHPALQGLGAALAFIALTWPLLVLERPLQVVVAFFAIWLGVIGLLFAFSRAPLTEPGELGGGPASGGPDARGD